MWRTLSASSLLLAAALAQATPADNTVQVAVTPNFSGGTGPYLDTHSGPGAQDAAGSATGGFSSSGFGQSHVEPGIVKLSGDSNGSLNTVTRGMLRDQLTFDVAGLAKGTLIAVTFNLKVNGVLAADDINIAAAGWSLSADLGGGSFDITRQATYYNNSSIFAKHGYVGDPFGLYSATVTIQSGFAVPLFVELDGSAQTGYQNDTNTPTHASFDLAHSLYWAGISAVTANGQAVGSFSVTSFSGADYAHSFAPAVPEPASGALLLAGLAGLLHHRRQRRD